MNVFLKRRRLLQEFCPKENEQTCSLQLSDSGILVGILDLADCSQYLCQIQTWTTQPHGTPQPGPPFQDLTSALNEPSQIITSRVR